MRCASMACVRRSGETCEPLRAVPPHNTTGVAWLSWPAGGRSGPVRHEAHGGGPVVYGPAHTTASLPPPLLLCLPSCLPRSCHTSSLPLGPSQSLTLQPSPFSHPQALIADKGGARAQALYKHEMIADSGSYIAQEEVIVDAVLKGKGHAYTVVVSTFEAACEAKFELAIYSEANVTVTTQLPDLPPGRPAMTAGQVQQQQDLEQRRQQERQMRMQQQQQAQAREEEDDDDSGGGGCVIL